MYWRSWQELSQLELYDAIQLRLQVFCVEQNCPYQDLDGLDQQAQHLLAYQDGKLVGYLRLFASEQNNNDRDHVVIGRVCCDVSCRNTGLGKRLMLEALKYSDRHYQKDIYISAQEYLTFFYEQLGFKKQTDVYLEDGIAHIGMLRNHQDMESNLRKEH